MIAGVVNSRGLPTVELLIDGRTWTAVIDTGFNGDLELPFALGPAVNARFIGHSRFQLAGDQSVVEETYEVSFPFDGRLVEVEATFSSADEFLLGTRVLRLHRLEVDFGLGTVRIRESAVGQGNPP